MKKAKSNAPRCGPSKTTNKHAKFSVDGDESDDGMSLNLQRREILDTNSKVKGKLFRVFLVGGGAAGADPPHYPKNWLVPPLPCPPPPLF